MAFVDNETFVSRLFPKIEHLRVYKEFAAYQMDGVKWLLNKEWLGNDVRGGFFCDDMGLGKTWQMLAICECNDVGSTLIIAPNNVTPEWSTAITRVTGNSAFFADARTKAPISDKYVVCSYNLFSGGRGGGAPSAITGKYWGRVILDEGHEVRNNTSKRSASISGLQAGIRWVVTATPVHNSMNDIVNLASWVGYADPQINLTNIISDNMLARTRDEVCKVDPSQELPGIEMFDILLEKQYQGEMDLYAHLKTSWKEGNKDVLGAIHERRQAAIHPLCYYKKDGREIKVGDVALPENYRDLPIKQLLLASKEGDTVIPPFIPVLAVVDDDEAPVMKRRRVDRKSKGGCAFDKVACSYSTKMVFIVRLLEEYADDKFVFFCTYSAEIGVVCAYLEKAGIGYSVFDGQLDKSKKETIVHNFSNCKSVRVLVSQIKCTAVGLNLQVAHRVIIVTPSFNPIIDIQAIHRCYRKGQKDIVYVYRPLIKDTVEVAIAMKSAGKLDIVSDVMGKSQDRYKHKDHTSTDELVALLAM